MIGIRNSPQPIAEPGRSAMKRLALILVVCLCSPALRAAEPKSFPAAKHGKGELRTSTACPS